MPHHLYTRTHCGRNNKSSQVENRLHRIGSRCVRVLHALSSSMISFLRTCSTSTREICPGLTLAYGLAWNRDPHTGCRPPLPLHVGTAGKNNLNEKITPLFPTGIGERYCRAISNVGHAALCADVNSHYKRKCWNNSGGLLVNSLLWGSTGCWLPLPLL